MIDFRYHLVSIIAIFFALAAGIALGAGPLKENVDATLTSQLSELRDDNRALRNQVAELERQDSYREGFDARVEQTLTAAALDNQRVALVALPGASSDVVAATRDSLRTAGADVPVTVSVQEKWTDPDQEKVLDQLASQLVSEGTTLPDGDGYDRGAALLAGALVSADAGPAASASATAAPTSEPTDGATDPQVAALAGLREAGLIQVEGDATGRAPLAVVVSGDPLSGDGAEDRNARLVTIARGMDASGGGTVVAGTEASAEGDGLVALIRGDDGAAQNISTVDVANLVSGRIATVFALVGQAAGTTGHYGAVGQTDGPLPADFATSTQ